MGRPHSTVGTAHPDLKEPVEKHSKAAYPLFKDIVTYDGEWVKNSFITISDKPGIGVEINEAGDEEVCETGGTVL